MVTIPVSIGYAYDYLSILEIKFDKVLEECLGSKKSSIDLATKNLMDCYNHLDQTLGNEVHLKIIQSKEYSDLYDINEQLYQAVDLAKTDSILASEVDALVYKRFLAKEALQKRFFPDISYREQKFGYK